jgi:hypothetical protein
MSVGWFGHDHGVGESRVAYAESAVTVSAITVSATTNREIHRYKASATRKTTAGPLRDA